MAHTEKYMDGEIRTACEREKGRKEGGDEKTRVG